MKFSICFTLNLFVHGRENPDRLMTLLLSKTKRLLIFYLLSGRLMSKMQLIVPPQNILQFNTNTRNTVEILFASPVILKVLAFSRVKPILCALILASWRTPMSTFQVNFNEDYLSLLSDFCSSPVYRNITLNIIWLLLTRHKIW